MRKFAKCMALMLFLVLLSAAVSAASMLEISDLTAEVDGDRQSADENGGTIDVIPDSLLVLKIKVANLYGSDVEGGEIENIDVDAVLEEIDDGDDLEESSDDFDLRGERDKTVRIEFPIPLKLYTDDTYKLTIHVEGKDKNNTRHIVDLDLDVDVKKKSHEIRFLRKELSPEKAECGSSSTLIINLIDTGKEDEDVEMVIDAPGLNYNKRLDFTLVEDIDDDDNEYDFSDTIDLEDVKEGEYPVNIRVLYRDGRETLEDVLYLEVDSCAAPEPEPEPAPEPQPQPVQQQPQPEPEPEPVSVVTEPAPSSSYVRPATIAVATPRTTYTQQSWWDKNKWVAIVLITNLVLIVAGIIVIVAVLKRRR